MNKFQSLSMIVILLCSTPCDGWNSQVCFGWQNFVPYENIQESGGTRYLPLLHSLHRAKLSGLFLHYLIINIGNFWILVESLYYQDYGWSAIWDGRKKLPHVGVSQKEGDSEFCPSTSCRLCPKVPWCQSSPQEHPGKCFQEGLVLMETAVFRVEIPEIGALSCKIVQKWVIRRYTRAAAVQE